MAKIIKQKLIDVKLEAEVPSYYFGWGNYNCSPEKKLEVAKRWLNELSDFLREHRDPPLIDITIVPVYKDVCSSCEEEIEVKFDPEFNNYFCASCCEVIEQSP